eukprot:CAMPEP_0179151370 /NCGR_PEP_ID=MMETSP0796-20121207/73483_1 /TAXON_ID=73915 /ORGANISM="Pyrodinium bahamense, Strain pbaha01" /LENGTH=103 /DNA_ID=CAMNT_0020852455 /DNA_START=190 /DNA_END=501 /DNA_ORIENTATION=-
MTFGSGEHLLPVSREQHGMHRMRVALQNAQALPRNTTPEPCREIPRPSEHLLTIRREGRRLHNTHVTLQRAQALPRCGTPQFGRGPCGDEHLLAVRGKNSNRH